MPVPELLERAEEMAALSRVASGLVRGVGCVVAIEAQAGTGKTSLLRAAEDLLSQASPRFLRARGAELEHEFAFGGVRQLFDPLLADPVTAPASDDMVAQLFETKGRVPLAREATSEFGLLHALYWWMVRLADQRPLAVIVDDVQWLDPPSLRFLGFLARRLEQMPAVMLVASRPAAEAEQRQLWSDLRAVASAVRLTPPALSEAAVRTVAAAEFGTEPAREFVAECWLATAGNPLFVQELVRLLHSRDVQPDATALTAVRESGPVAVAAHVESRLARQPESVQRLAAALAVLGPQTSVATAAAVAALTAGEAEEACDRLVRLGLLTGGRSLSYAHPLLQAAVYESLSPIARSRAHATAAAALGEVGAPAERQAAHILHLAPAGDRPRLAVLLAAASEARRRSAVDTAATYLRRAAEEPPPTAQRSEIYRQLGNCEAYSLQAPAAEGHLRQAVELAEPGPQRALSLYSLGRLMEAVGRPVDARQALETAVNELRSDDASGLRTRLEAELAGYARVVLSDRTRMLGYLAALAVRTPDDWAPLPFVRLAHEAVELSFRGRPAGEVLAAAEGALAGERLAPDLSALWMAIHALLAGGSYSSAGRHLEHAVARARQQGLAVTASLCRANQAVAALWQGDLAEARLYLDLGWAASDITDHATPVLAGCEAELLIELGDLNGAFDVLRRRAPGAQAMESSHALQLIYARGRAELAAGNPEAAVETFRHLGAMYRQWGAGALLDRSWRCGQASALAGCGQPSEGSWLVEEELELARASGVPRALGHALRTRAALAYGADGPANGCLTLAEEAVAVLSTGQARLELAHAHADRGRLLLARNYRSDARYQLRTGWELAVDCGASQLAGELRAQLTSAGGRLPRLRTTGMAALTASERRIARLAGSDRTNREIARELYITEKTVEGHLSSAYRKLGVRSRPELAAILASSEVPA